MKKTLLTFSILLLGFGIGWIFSYLRLPHLSLDSSFLLGAILSALLIIIIQLLGKRYRLKGINSLILLLLALVLIYTIDYYSELKRIENSEELTARMKEIEEKQLLITSQEKTNQFFMVNQLINEIQSSEYEDSLDTRMIASIINLSQVLQPIRGYPIGESDVPFLSPGRGHLLLSLMSLNLDSLSWKKIVKNSDFSYSDLRALKLRSANWSGINIEGSSLNSTDLVGVNLRNARMSNLQARDVEIIRSDLSSADMINSNLNWARIKKSNLQNTKLSGCSLINSSFSEVNMKDVYFWHANLKGANVSNSDMRVADLWTTNFDSASFSKVDFSYARFTDTKFLDTKLDSVNVHFTAAPIDWFEYAKRNRVIGLSSIESEYVIQSDSSKRFPVQKYFLKRKD